MTSVRFFNTYEPVTDFYRHLLPEMSSRGLTSVVYLSRCDYRAGRDPIESGVEDLAVTIRRLPALGRTASTRLKKSAAAAMYLIFASLLSVFGKSVSLNVFLTQPPMFGFWGLVLKRLRRQPYVVVLMDIYPDCLIAARQDHSVVGVMRLLDWVSRKTWRCADGVVCIGRCMQDLVIANGVDPARVIMIPNWADESRIVPMPPEENPIRNHMGWARDFIVLYSGNMGVAHEFDGLLRAAVELADIDDIRFVFIGDGARKAEIEQFKSDHQLDKLHMMPPQPAEYLADSQTLGDIHFVCLRHKFTGLMVPSKAYSALAAGKPILYGGDAGGEIAQLILEENIGLVVDARDSNAIRDAILTSYHDPSGRLAAGIRARKIACKNYSAGRAVEKYADYFEGLLTSLRSQPGCLKKTNVDQ